MSDDLGFNSILNRAVEDLKNFYGKDAEILKNQSTRFLKGLKELMDVYWTIDNNAKKLSITEIYSSMRQEQALTQALIRLQYTYEECLNKFLRRKINLTWVGPNGQIWILDEAYAVEVYQLAAPKNEGKNRAASGRGQVSVSKFNQVKENHQKHLKDIYKEIQKSDFQSTYMEVRSRWQKNHTQDWTGEIAKYLKEYNKKDTFWWVVNSSANLPSDKYDWSKKMNSTGGIAEAYANLVLRTALKQEDNLNLKGDWSEEKIYLYYNYMLSHEVFNNTSGIAEGDINIMGETTQYAIKTGSQFNTAAIGPTIQAATILSSMDLNLITTDNVLTILNNLTRLPDVIKEKINDFANQEVQKAIGEAVGGEQFFTDLKEKQNQAIERRKTKKDAQIKSLKDFIG